MEAELATLAATGATTLVGLMVSEAWNQTRGRLARFFARGDDTALPDEQLAASREELIAARDAADADTAADVEEEWRLRLRRTLRADPGAAEELRLLLDELAPQAAPLAITVHNNISGVIQNGPAIQGQHFSSLTFHSPAVQSPEQGPGTL
ncbi:hypothetical protein YWIDRAFT_07693 [Streptomyces sp. SceaMP-e96]|uniref:hypothetical protein n=1 Tax=Streptomyces TaxID=1883 RepID=UPI000823A813|nr:hypothetical protein [Streptomyces sp. SceaMP-e96]MYT18036.1 hypothetical protein [Streptomyces sp. SID4951]SCK50491.1 hypothetical protein YWIDRAFT_07693 [Streptomyces sp. SceaMP-e96]